VTSQRQQRWQRLARLVVALLAFVIARPAPAAPRSFDCIVLVAGAGPLAESPEENRAVAPAPAETSRARIVVRTEHALRHEPLAGHEALPAPITKKYLRHCSFLC
jgi:hypothetical protein